MRLGIQENAVKSREVRQDSMDYQAACDIMTFLSWLLFWKYKLISAEIVPLPAPSLIQNLIQVSIIIDLTVSDQLCFSSEKLNSSEVMMSQK